MTAEMQTGPEGGYGCVASIPASLCLAPGAVQCQDLLEFLRNIDEERPGVRGYAQRMFPIICPLHDIICQVV